MDEDGRDRVVVEVADALTLDQDVDWDRCAREAAPASRRTLDNLRLVAGLLADFRAPGDTAAASGLPGGVAVRFAVRALIVVAALWAAASLMVGLWGWDEFRRESPELTLYLALVVAGSAATGCLFLFAGRRDHRTWLWGATSSSCPRWSIRSRSSASSGGRRRSSRSATPTSPSPRRRAARSASIRRTRRRTSTCCWMTTGGGSSTRAPTPSCRCRVPGRSCWASWWRAGVLDGRLARPVDIPFLEALWASAGLALVRVLATPMQAAGSLEAPAAEECPACGCVSEAGEPAACDCGAAYVETAGPKLLADKYRLIRRLGRGGMGAAYLARDLRLEPDVAIKTLTGESVFRLMGSKPEAWAMDAPGGGADPRHRVVAGPAVSRRRVPAARDPRRPAAARAGARVPRPRHRRPAGRRPPGRALMLSDQ